MKKLIAGCFLIVFLLGGGIGMEAKTKKKSKARTSITTKTTKVIGTFTYENSYSYKGVKCKLLANGKINTSDRCWKGRYDKIGTDVYKLWFWGTCGDDGEIVLIVGDDVYSLYGGTDMSFDYDYEPNTKIVIILDYKGMPADEIARFCDFPSASIPLSYFDKIGTINWTGK